MLIIVSLRLRWECLSWHNTLLCYDRSFYLYCFNMCTHGTETKTYPLKCNEMRIIMSIREKRYVMTNAMALRQSSSHPLMRASPILHACRPDEMYTRSVLIYSIHFQYHPGVSRCIYIDPGPNLSRVIPWESKAMDAQTNRCRQRHPSARQAKK